MCNTNSTRNAPCNSFANRHALPFTRLIAMPRHILALRPTSAASLVPSPGLRRATPFATSRERIRVRMLLTALLVGMVLATPYAHAAERARIPLDDLRCRAMAAD